MIRSVLLSGYYGFGNVGDDALLAVLAAELTAAGVEQILVPAGDAGPLDGPPGVQPLGRNDVGAMRAALRCGAAVISGGGGLLQDATSLRSLVYYLGVLALARLQHRPYAIGWQSVGPLRRPTARAAVRWFARRAAAVTVRDRASAETLTHLGVRRAVTVSADPAFALPPPTAAELTAAKATLPPGPCVVFCLRPTRHAAAVTAAVRDWCAARPPGLQVALLACQEQDHALHRQVAADLPEVAVLPPPGVRRTQALLAAADAVVTERLHPMIFAASAGTPVAAIDYDPKVRGQAADLDVPVAGSDAALTGALLAPAVTALLSWTPDQQQALRQLADAAADRFRGDLRALLASLG